MATLNRNPVPVAILVEAPRFVTFPNADHAAPVEARLIERTVEAAKLAAVGPVTMWVAPDRRQPTYETLAAFLGVAVAEAPYRDLGARIHSAAAAGPAIVIATVRAALAPKHVREAASLLADGVDIVTASVDDEIVLIGMQQSKGSLFAGIDWSGGGVMPELRGRLTRLGLVCRQLPRLSTVDVAAAMELRSRQGLVALMG